MARESRPSGGRDRRPVWEEGLGVRCAEGQADGVHPDTILREVLETVRPAEGP